MKSEPAESDPVAKKRKTEWNAALRKMDGDTKFVKDPIMFSTFYLKPQRGLVRCQEILEFLARFHDTQAEAGQDLPHPVDVVLSAFNTPEKSQATMTQLKNFLEETNKAFCRVFENAEVPEHLVVVGEACCV